MEKKKNGKKIVIISISTVLIIALAVCFFIFILPVIHYSIAESAFANENYAVALEEYNNAGTYRDARAKAKYTVLVKAYFEGTDAFENGDYSLACEKFLEAGEYGNSAEWLENSRLGEHYTNGQALLDSGDYKKAIEEFSAAGGFSGASEKILEAKYALAVKYADEKNEPEAIKIFTELGDYNDSKEKTLEAKYALAVKYIAEKNELEAAKIFSELGAYSDSAAKLNGCAVSLFEQERYEEAETAFNLDKTSGSSEYKSYCSGKVAMANKNYSSAVSCFRSAKTIKDGEQLYMEASYLLGKDLFSKKDYSAAKNAFSNSGDYSNSADMIIACDVMTAEQKLIDGDLKAAQTAYNKLPDNYEYNGIKASERKALLAKYQPFIDLIGTWEVTSNLIETDRYSTWGYEGGWYKDGVVFGQWLEINCKFNSNNTITISGSVRYHRYTNFAYNEEYIETEYKTVYFEEKNITSIPSTIIIDKQTKLNYSGGVFTLKYEGGGDKSSWATDWYTSTVTYGKKIS